MTEQRYIEERGVAALLLFRYVAMVLLYEDTA